MKLRSAIYLTGQLMGDVNAVRNGTIIKRITRRLLGRYTGKTMMRKLMGTTRHAR